MKVDKKEYTNEEVTVVWKSDLCIHAANCANGLHEVFNPKSRPWINMDGASSKAIIDQVKKCPSGALSFYINDAGPENIEDASSTIKAMVKKGGPLLVEGSIVVIDHDGNEAIKSNVTAFCRCGLSSNKPYCDGSHKSSDFDA